MQVGTNHLGHFALTGLLLPKITSRVVTLSSTAHKLGRIDLTDLNWQRRRYHAWGAYSQAKLANLMFAYELQRRLTASGSSLRSIAAHPGYAATQLQSHTESMLDRVMVMSNRFFAQSAAMGALPSLYAATNPDVSGGSYVGPDGLGEARGYPRIVDSSTRSKDLTVAAGLWTLSEELVTVKYP